MKYQNKNFHMVKVYDNIIPDKLCQILIAAFESCNDQEFIDDDNCPCFTQVNVNHASRGLSLIHI